jgi:hypothetical protein
MQYCFISPKILNFKNITHSCRISKFIFLNKKNNDSKIKRKNKIFMLDELKKKEKPFFQIQTYLIFALTFIFTIFLFKNFRQQKNNLLNIVYSISFKEKSAFNKLQTIPVFSVVNRFGQPFLIQNKKGEHIGLIFFSHLEALEYAKDLEKYNQATNSQIYIMSLDKAFKMVNQGPTSSGIKDKFGQDIKMRFHFVPSKTEIKNAINITKKNEFNENLPLIPIFTIEGLTICRGKENISPMFFSKEDCVKAWLKILKNDPSLPKYPEIIGGDFMKLILFMRLDEEYKIKIQDIFNFGFVPSSKSLDFIKKESKPEPTAKMIELKKVY